MNGAIRTAAIAWLITAVYYFYQYTLRSAPAVMMPQLSEAFGLTTAGVASLVGLVYYGYSPFSLVAGVAAFLASDAASQVNGQTVSVNGGLSFGGW